MNRFLIITVSILFLFFNCKETETELIDANAIIKTSIETSGGAKFNASVIGFDFRDRYYRAIRSKGNFQLERYTTDSINNTIKDVLLNNGFRRYINDELVEVTDSMTVKYKASVNSVHYFSVLPYGLDAKAVNKNYLGKTKIKEQEYHKIKVTFSEEGGGEDFEDVFIYWININTNKADYLAYSYNEEDGLGLRFREAYNERFVNGLRFVDYNNYKPHNSTVSVTDLDSLFESNQLTLLSKIELKKITVN